jgi:hypothetical protein
MPDPNRLLTTLAKAVEHFRNTPGRRGRLVELEGDEVLVAGDLHGNVENLRRLLRKADLGNSPRRHLVLQEVVHGPFRYPSGGDKSHQLLDLLAALKCQYPHQVHFLLGNHELSQWTGRRITKDDVDLNEVFREGIGTAYGGHADAVCAAYQALFAVVPVAVRTANRVYLSHSLPSAARLATFDAAVIEREDHGEDDLQLGGSVHALVWGRDTSAATAAAFLRKVNADLLLTGHIPCPEGFAVPNDRQVILDTLGSPACYCLFPTGRPLAHPELVGCVRVL